MNGFWDFFEKIDFNAVGNVVTMFNPVAGAVIKTIDAIVVSENESISNDSVVKVVESMSKSDGNDLDQDLVNEIASLIANKGK